MSADNLSPDDLVRGERRCVNGVDASGGAAYAQYVRADWADSRIAELERLAKILKDDLDLTAADRDSCRAKIAELESQNVALSNHVDLLIRTSRTADEMRSLETGGDQPCCENYDDCEERCVQLVKVWRARAHEWFEKKQPPPPPIETPKSRGFCGLHSWGAPPGEDDLICPYCIRDAELCPHGFRLAENVCGPCSQGRPNRSAQPSPPPESSRDVMEKELGAVLVCGFIDRMKDICAEDTAADIVSDFIKTVRPILDRYLSGKPSPAQFPGRAHAPTAPPSTIYLPKITPEIEAEHFEWMERDAGGKLQWKHEAVDFACMLKSLPPLTRHEPVERIENCRNCKGTLPKEPFMRFGNKFCSEECRRDMPGVKPVPEPGDSQS